MGGVKNQREGHTQDMGELAKRVDKHVGKCIRGRRAFVGLTQQDLAEALGISYQQHQKYETGANRVSAGRLYEIAMRLGVDVGYFFEGLDPTSERAPMEHGGRERSTINLVRDFYGISDPGIRSAVSGLVRSLSQKGLR